MKPATSDYGTGPSGHGTGSPGCGRGSSGCAPGFLLELRLPRRLNRRIARKPRGMLAPLRPRRLGAVAGLLALVAGLGACFTSGALKPTGGGIAGRDSARVSAVVAQTRAQFPDLSAGGLSYSQRGQPAEPDERALPPVLRGTGVSVRPGIQRGSKARGEFVLYLDKPAYSSGYLQINEEGKGQLICRILAFEHRGKPGAEFEFLYLLGGAGCTPARYLALIGGRFSDGGEDFIAIEGTVVVPEPKGGISGWREGFKIDFGSRMPLEPVYQIMVAETGLLFKRLGRRISGLEIRRQRIARREEALAELRQNPADESNPGRIREEQSGLEELRTRFGSELSEAQSLLLRYFGWREKIAGAYAKFTTGNRYSWAAAGEQQDFYDRWKQVELHHPKIDELVRRLEVFLKNPASVRKARATAMAAVKRHNNWDKDPSRRQAKRE